MTKLDDPGVMAQVRHLRLQRGFTAVGVAKVTGLSQEDAGRAIRLVDAGQSGKAGRKRAVDDARVAQLTRQGLSNEIIAQRLGVAVATIKDSRRRFREAAE